MVPSPNRVLIVDDDRVMQEMLRDTLAADDLDVAVCPHGTDLVTCVHEQHVRVVIADFIMPGAGGFELIERLASRRPEVELVVLTSYGTVESAVRAIRLGAFDYLQKPVSPEALRATVLRALESQRCLRSHPSLALHTTLHDACSRLLLTDNRAALEAAGIAALCAVTGARSGLFVSWNWEKGEHQLATHALDDTRAAEIASRVEELVLRLAPERPCVIPDEGGTPMLVVPLARAEVSAALIAVGPPPLGFVRGHLDDAAYLAGHLSFAMLSTLRHGEGHAQGFVDELTGLHNTRYFDVVLQRELVVGRGDGGSIRAFSVLLLNIDYIRRVNDRLGHLTGSKVLVEMARVLRRCVREVDPVFRYGGDEFAVILRGTDKQSALHVAERIRKAIEAHPFLAREGLDLRLTASLGIAAFPEHGQAAEVLIDLADRALLQGKRDGRNAVHVATEAAPS